MTAGRATIGRLTCWRQGEGGNGPRPEGQDVLSNPGLRSGTPGAVVVVGTEGRSEKGPAVKVVLLPDPPEPRSARVEAEAWDTCGLSQTPDEGDHQGCGTCQQEGDSRFVSLL